MDKLEKAKQIIKENFDNARCGIFNIRNFVGDTMTELYDDGELKIDICYPYSYFEVFGLTYSEFEQLEAFYDSLR